MLAYTIAVELGDINRFASPRNSPATPAPTPALVATTCASAILILAILALTVGQPGA